jgi:hypothetical protein
MVDMSPGQQRTIKARQALMRKTQHLRAESLRDVGWLCIPPWDDRPIPAHTSLVDCADDDCPLHHPLVPPPPVRPVR